MYRDWGVVSLKKTPAGQEGVHLRGGEVTERRQTLVHGTDVGMQLGGEEITQPSLAL